MGSNSLHLVLCFRTFLFLLLFTIFCTFKVSCSERVLSYKDNCASIVPESIPGPVEFTAFPFRLVQEGYYKGGYRLSNQKTYRNSPSYPNVFSFQTHNVYKTDAEAVYMIKASLILHSSRMLYYSRSSYPRVSHQIGDLNFNLEGFWSKSTGNLCMVGTGSAQSHRGKLLDLAAVVLKLYSIKKSSAISTLVKGSLESLSAPDELSYFDPISLLVFPRLNYNYTKALDEFDYGGGIDVPERLSLSLPLSRPICSILTSRSVNAFELEYESNCDSGEACNPFGEDIGYLPQVMSLSAIQCSHDQQHLTFLVEFPPGSYIGYYPTLNFNTTLVGEGLWDANKNQLRIIACRILDTSSSFDDSHVEDCSIRMSLRFPSVWSIRNTSSVMGHIWSNKSVNDSGFFEMITFRNSENKMVIIGVPGLKYEYNEIERVRKSCLKKKPNQKNGDRYPNGYAQEMRFHMTLKNSKGTGWGYSIPIYVGDQISQWYQFPVPLSGSRPAKSAVEANTNNSSPMNISYKVSFRLQPGAKLNSGISPFNFSSNKYSQVQISAEGVYDVETGFVCMVGCRFLSPNEQKFTNDSMDCQILVTFQFPSINSKTGGYLKGGIESTREKYDPLYFDPLSLSATVLYSHQLTSSVWTMDLELIMVLISNTLACVCMIFQFLYVKKNPNVLPFTSLLMLVILTLGHMIPLVLNFEAMFMANRNRQNVLLESGGWLEVNEVIVRIITMVAFLLQFRLLQLTLSSRLSNGKAFWVAETKAFIVSLPMYMAGGLIVFFVNWRRNSFGTTVSHPFRTNRHKHYLWGDLRSYTGLILDGFLLPQILFNIFQNSRENVLSHFFYLGTTCVRLLPHAYDLYRAHNYVQHLHGSYIYAKPGADFYSTAWDVIIPCGGLLFAAIIYLQQRFGGRFFLPLRFRELEGYENVQVISDA